MTARARRSQIALALLVITALGACNGGKSTSTSTSSTSTTVVGPAIYDPNVPNSDWHWHAALGVFDCDHWMGDSTGNGVWQWPAATPQGEPGRANDPNTYAGLHSHDDGIIHMEPATPDEAGTNATLGRYFEFGGWKLSATGFTFLGTTRANGDKCATKPATLQWWVHGKAHTGDPAAYKLYDRDIVVLAFVPAATPCPGRPPSAKNLP
jgi:hypothetical protein